MMKLDNCFKISGIDPPSWSDARFKELQIRHHGSWVLAHYKTRCFLPHVIWFQITRVDGSEYVKWRCVPFSEYHATQKNSKFTAGVLDVCAMWISMVFTIKTEGKLALEKHRVNIRRPPIIMPKTNASALFTAYVLICCYCPRRRLRGSWKSSPPSNSMSVLLDFRIVKFVLGNRARHQILCQRCLSFELRNLSLEIEPAIKFNVSVACLSSCEICYWKSRPAIQFYVSVACLSNCEICSWKSSPPSNTMSVLLVFRAVKFVIGDRGPPSNSMSACLVLRNLKLTLCDGVHTFVCLRSFAHRSPLHRFHHDCACGSTDGTNLSTVTFPLKA